MTANSGYVTLMLISDAETAPRVLRLPRLFFRVGIGVLIFGALVVAISLLTLPLFLRYSSERKELLEEKARMVELTAKIGQLEQDLQSNRLLLKKMTQLAGIDLDELGVADLGERDTPTTDSGDSKRKGSVSRNASAHPVPSGLPVKGWISRPFRPEDENPKIRHFGVDIAVGVGSLVTATADGLVTFAGWDSTFGWKVVMSHAESVETIYGHNQELLVEVGDRKQFGEPVAISGNTGVSSAPHVHYEVRKDGQPVNPEEYFR